MKKTNDKQFLQTSKTLFTANAIVNSNTGEEFSITPEFKIIYFWMRDQYVFYKNNKQDYFASFQDILFQCTTLTYDRRAKRVFKLMQDLGLLVCIGKNKNTNKQVLDITELPHLILKNEQYDEFKVTSVLRKDAKTQRLAKWKAKKIQNGEWHDHNSKKELPSKEPVSPLISEEWDDDDFDNMPF